MTHSETIYNVAERLQKLEILIPDEAYAALFQSLRNDVRDLHAILKDLIDNAPGVYEYLDVEAAHDQSKE